MDCKKSVLNAVGVSLVLASVSLISACGGDSSSAGTATTTPAEEVEKPVLPAARGLLPALARADATFEGGHYSGSDACTSCHNDPEMIITTPISGETRNVSLGTAWETSVMANATRDPYWHAVVASELDNHPGLDAVINDKCIVCHAPMAQDMAKKEGVNMRLFDTGSIENGDFQQGMYSMTEEDELFNHAMDGVSCSFCHQMEDVNFGNAEGMSGHFTVLGSPTTDVADRPAYGQYTDPDVGYMRQQAAFLPQYGAHLSTSESCATCHNLDIDPIDTEGNAIEGVGHFSEQAAYTEWLNSDYALGGSKEATCQGCHMPKLDQEVLISQGAPAKRAGFSEHVFLGPNTVLQDMLKNFSEELGLKPDMDFDSAIARNRVFLTTAADVTLSEGSLANDTLTFDVTITNNTGHKLPSGYHSRRVFLNVQVLDANGQLVFESGKTNADGSIVGVSEDVNPAVWEKHYDVISSPTQVQVYQAIVANSKGDRTHSLIDVSYYLKDNRLVPSGMNIHEIKNDTSLPETFGTFGKAIEDPDFNNGLDTVTYQVSVPGAGAYTVAAELRYQPFSYGHLQKLFTQSERVDQVDMFRTIYDATSLRYEVIDTATQTMQ